MILQLSYWLRHIEWRGMGVCVVAEEPSLFLWSIIKGKTVCLPAHPHRGSSQIAGTREGLSRQDRAEQGSCSTEWDSHTTRTQWIMSSLCDVCCRGRWRLSQETVMKHSLKPHTHSEIWFHFYCPPFLLFLNAICLIRFHIFHLINLHLILIM